MLLLNELFKFVILTSASYKIDESHALKHSMDVYHYGNKIFNEEIKHNPLLQNNKISSFYYQILLLIEGIPNISNIFF